MADLRQVFELCSPDSEGYILTDVLTEKLKQQIPESDLSAIQSALDPGREGRISFNKFETIVSNLQDGESTPPVKKSLKEIDRDSSGSDPENTYNEYDMAEDEFGDNFEAVGESHECLSHTLSPSTNNFTRNSSIRRSHRRTSSYNTREEMLFRDETASVTSDFDDLSEKVECLKDQVTRLEEEKNIQIQYETVKHEKQQLALRNHDLEERLNSSIEAVESIKSDTDVRLRELQHKLDREYTLQMEVLQSKLHNCKSEKQRLEDELKNIRDTSTELREDNQRLQTKVESLTAQVLQTNEEYRFLNQQATAQREKLEGHINDIEIERETMHEQMQELHSDKCALAQRLSIVELNAKPNMEALASKLSSLENENQQLKSVNEDLNMQLAKNIVGARSLMGVGQDQTSIAEEMASATRDEVMEALQRQEEQNAQLREYLDKIILSVLEKDPSILEIR